jgi:hypothetical protein
MLSFQFSTFAIDFLKNAEKKIDLLEEGRVTSLKMDEKVVLGGSVIPLIEIVA